MADKDGFICIHRQLQEHWLWNDANKLKWWLDILLTVNSAKKDVPIGNEIFVCDRGQSIKSLQTWATRWGVSKDTARNFLNLLKKDNMILHENIGKSTRITVCNYDTYNCLVHDKQTTARRKTNTNNSILSKDSIDNRKLVFKKELEPYLPIYGKDLLNSFFIYWTEKNTEQTKMKFEMQKTWELNLRLKKWKANGFDAPAKKNGYKNQEPIDHSQLN